MIAWLFEMALFSENQARMQAEEAYSKKPSRGGRKVNANRN